MCIRDRFNDVVAVVDGAAVMGLEHHKFDGLIAEFFRHLPGGKEVAQRFAHLPVIHVDKAVVHPVVGVGLAGAALPLGDLIFMVGEHQVVACLLYTSFSFSTPLRIFAPPGPWRSIWSWPW